MSKMVKELITKDLSSRYAAQDNAVWVEMVGIDGITTNTFRRELREKAMRLEVVRTALLRKACVDGPLAKLADALEGPAALLTGGESPIDIAKLLDDWKPKFPKNSLRLRGALVDGEYFDEAAVQTLHKMPTKQDLQAKIVGIALSPGGNLAAAVLSGGSNLAGCLKAMIEKLEDGEEIKKSA